MPRKLVRRRREGRRREEEEEEEEEEEKEEGRRRRKRRGREEGERPLPAEGEGGLMASAIHRRTPLDSLPLASISTSWWRSWTTLSPA